MVTYGGRSSVVRGDAASSPSDCSFGSGSTMPEVTVTGTSSFKSFPIPGNGTFTTS